MPEVEITCTDGRSIRPIRLEDPRDGAPLELVSWSPTRESSCTWEGEVESSDGRRFHLSYGRAMGWEVREL
ncbi:MAG: hypothetical protein P1V51_14895 [Deltaproteobacteria bacterium]|nr:hypothetical protein [Deltaproteobacteria bacterium]